FNEDSDDPDQMRYEADMAYDRPAYNPTEPTGRWPYLYVKAERPEPPTFYPPYDLNINPNSEQMGVSISCPSGDLKLVYVRDDEQGDHKLDYDYEYITLPQDHGVGIEAYSCDSRFFIFSDAANWASHYYSVVVPNPTYNPAPGEYLANQLRVTLSQINNDDIYVNAHRQGYPSTIDPANGEGAKYTGPMILDDVSWYVIAYAEDANGNRSEVVPGRYSIRTPMPFNFYRVKSNDEIKPGREYIAVYCAPSDYYGMTQQDVNGKRGYIGNDYSVLTDPSYAIMGGLVYLVEDDMAYVNKPIVSIFGLGEKDNDNQYTLYDFNAGAYVNAAEGAFATVATTDAATTHFSISIDEQSNNYDASITTDGKILVFNTTDNTFAFEDENVVADNLMPVTLYWRPNSHMTLKELKETLADGDPDNPADDGGDKEREVTISDPLVVAYVARPKIADEATIIVLRDNAEATEGILEKGPNQKSLLIKGVNDKYVNTVPQEEYTQNNWIAVLMPYNADDYEVGQTIKGGTLHGYIDGDKLLIMAFNAQRQPEIDLTADPVDVVYNTYIPANFNSSYWNQDSEYFMMMPKPIEVFNMTYALYSEGGMYTPDDGGVQTLGMTGGVDVYAIGLYTNGKLPSGQAIGIEDSNETLFDGMENQEFEFQGVILPNGFLDDDEFDGFEDMYGDGYVMYNYGTDQATGQAGKPAPRRYNANTSNKYGNGGVLLLDIDASDQGTITGVKDVKVDSNAKVKAVRYYNVAGMVSDKPFDGVNIIVTEMTDGTRVTTKEIK
ncbi:MAG: hypothetical protein IK092_06085, partial [Muribaculaceae bacterium]|nr:hypothetical protein [Muribaculaceae bacterium]